MNPLIKFKDNCKEIWEYRNVLMALIRRNTAGRYKNTFVGFGWHLLNPILLILVMDLVFGTIRPRPIDDFWIYLSAGMFPVTFMSGCLRGNAITSSANYIKKMYFPTEIAVLANVIAQFLALIFAYLIIIIVILSYGQPVNWFGMGMLIVELILMFFFAVGCSMLISTATVFVKDIGNLASIIMRLVIWITPTFFFVSEAKGILATIVWFNPFTYFVEVFHDVLYYQTFPNLYFIGMSALLALCAMVIGWTFMNHYKSRFPEVL